MNLGKLYDKLYRRKTWQEKPEEANAIIEMMDTWAGLNVLEIGCGEGALASMISRRGAKTVHAIDLSSEAIKAAKFKYKCPGLVFTNCDFNGIDSKYDVVVMQGVLEHLSHPFQKLRCIIQNNLFSNGCVITSSPNFLNPRGYVWMVFQHLLDVEMSLADKYFFDPSQFMLFCRRFDYGLSMVTCDQDWGCGKRALEDYGKRFRSESFQKKINLEEFNIQKFLSWFERANQSFERHKFSGATMVYKIHKGEKWKS
jgi:SAM-dependent methyltransferase